MKRGISFVLLACLMLAITLNVAVPSVVATDDEVGSLFKPQVSNELLYWGSTSVNGKNQTVKFTGTLKSPSNNYNKAQYFVSLRADTMGNPWDGASTGYWIIIDNTATHVRYNGSDIFYTCDDKYASEPGYEETRWVLTEMEDAAGGREAFWKAEHTFEFSAINEEGGVRLMAKVDGRVVLNWLDTQKRVDKAGGFSIRTEDVYEWRANRLSYTGDDGKEMHMLTKANVGKLCTNTTNFGGYATAENNVSEQPDDEYQVPELGDNVTQHGSLYKPQVNNELLYWGSTQLKAKAQTLKFTGFLHSPSGNYNKAQYFVSLRAGNMGNPWDGAATGYWIIIDNTAVHVRYNGSDIFNTGNDSYADVPGYAETRWTLTEMIDSAGGGERFWGQYHEFEFSAINEDGGVRLIAKVDGRVILNWLDTAKKVDKTGGFSIRTEDVYVLNATNFYFAGDDGNEVDLLSEQHIGKLETNTTGFGGYVSTEALPPSGVEPGGAKPEDGNIGDYLVDTEFDMSQCSTLDFSELVADTYDWTGQIRNYVGMTTFYPNGLELLKGADKNAAYTKEDASFENFCLNFTMKATVTDEFIERNNGDWLYIFSFRDSSPTRNTWDMDNKNAYAILLEYHPHDGTSSLHLRRYNNTTSSARTTNILTLTGLMGLVGEENTWRIATYTTDEGVRIGVWADDVQLINVLDRDKNAVREGGSFMIVQHGTVVNTAIPIVKSILIRGLEKGADRPVYALGVNEPKPEGSDLYPLNKYQKPDLSAPAESSNNMSWTWIVVAVAAVVIIATVVVIVVVKRKGGKKA